MSDSVETEQPAGAQGAVEKDGSASAGVASPSPAASNDSAEPAKSGRPSGAARRGRPVKTRTPKADKAEEPRTARKASDAAADAAGAKAQDGAFEATASQSGEGAQTQPRRRTHTKRASESSSADASQEAPQAEEIRTQGGASETARQSDSAPRKAKSGKASAGRAASRRTLDAEEIERQASQLPDEVLAELPQLPPRRRGRPTKEEQRRRAELEERRRREIEAALQAEGLVPSSDAPAEKQASDEAPAAESDVRPGRAARRQHRRFEQSVAEVEAAEGEKPASSEASEQHAAVEGEASEAPSHGESDDAARQAEGEQGGYQSRRRRQRDLRSGERVNVGANEGHAAATADSRQRHDRQRDQREGDRQRNAQRDDRYQQNNQNQRSDRQRNNGQNDRNGRYDRFDRNDRNDRNNDRNDRRNRRNQGREVLAPKTNREELEELKVSELRAKATELEIDPAGLKKPELIDAVYNALVKQEGFYDFTGILDITSDGFGYVRTRGYLPSEHDVYVGAQVIRQNGLRRGDELAGIAHAGRPNDKFAGLNSITTVNGRPLEESRNRPRFADLTPVFPNERLRMEHGKDSLLGRCVDLVAPIGKGQRGLIVSPPKAGKTTVLKRIAESIAENNPEVHLICLLVDERPEEVTDMQRSIHGEVVASTFDMPSDNHITVSELVIERAKRLVELGQDVVILLDSITRLARAYNLAQPASGRILSGGVDSTALYPPKRFLGAARNIENGGSLTILASALVETGSKMDEVIFEEFKGTGNMELKLDRDLADRRIFPAIDPIASGTRKEELLLDPNMAPFIWGLRRILAGMNSNERAMTQLIKSLRATATNEEFLIRSAKKAAQQEMGADL